MTVEEIETFKREGAVVLKKFIPQALVRPTGPLRSRCQRTSGPAELFPEARARSECELLAQVDQWVDEYWRFMQADPKDPATWPGKPMFDLSEHWNTRHASNLGGALTGAGFRVGTLDAGATPLTELANVQAVAEQLGGGNQGCQPKGFPGVPRDPLAPRRGPLDPLQIGKVPWKTLLL
jgi:hypothetical protein